MQMSRRIMLVAGPCSAESYEQVMACARALQRDGRTSYFRAGVWKPRTRPGGFEGMGELALPWLQAVQEELGMPVCVEVAVPEHVELAHRYGIRSFWIGARTTSDPFAVENLACAMRSTDSPVFVKNPISPDLELWIGAIERVRRQGISDVHAVLRGFYTLTGGKYRNVPRWDVALALRSRLPELTILCDPSHIAGRRDLLLEVSAKACDYSFDGLFVEVHPTPDQALSDAKQQLTPENFSLMLDAMPIAICASAQNGHEQLELLRDEIDSIDEQIIALLGMRMERVAEIGRWKVAHGESPYDAERWRSLLLSHMRIANTSGLPADFTRRLSDLIHTESLRLQGEQRQDLRQEEP